MARISRFILTEELEAFAAANALDGAEGTYWATADGVRAASLTLQLPGARWFNVVSIREHLPLGLRVDDGGETAGLDLHLHDESGYNL